MRKALLFHTLDSGSEERQKPGWARCTDLSWTPHITGTDSGASLKEKSLNGNQPHRILHLYSCVFNEVAVQVKIQVKCRMHTPAGSGGSLETWTNVPRFIGRFILPLIDTVDALEMPPQLHISEAVILTQRNAVLWRVFCMHIWNWTPAVLKEQSAEEIKKKEENAEWQGSVVLLMFCLLQALRGCDRKQAHVKESQHPCCGTMWTPPKPHLFYSDVSITSLTCIMNHEWN